MGITKADADKLSLWEYEAILWNHNEAHRPADEREKGAPLEPPDPKIALPLLDAINADPRLTGP